MSFKNKSSIYTILTSFRFNTQGLAFKLHKNFYLFLCLFEGNYPFPSCHNKYVFYKKKIVITSTTFPFIDEGSQKNNIILEITNRYENDICLKTMGKFGSNMGSLIFLFFCIYCRKRRIK